jgi:hypothetical protein
MASSKFKPTTKLQYEIFPEVCSKDEQQVCSKDEQQVCSKDEQLL